MPRSHPRFSIVIPTHNRAHLLRLALRSVLNQEFDDFEVLVSDDSSTDDTPSVVAECGSPRVSHLRTPQRFSMANHFEWASTKGSGEFVMFLCDDDALSPDALRRVDAVIRETGTEVVALASGLYYHSAGSGLGNRLKAAQYSGRTITCESGAVLRAMFDRLHNALTPRGNNSFTHRRVIERIRTEAGRAFLDPAADSSFCCLVLATVPRYALLDEPVHLFGVSTESIGYDQENRRGEASEAFRRAAGGNLFRLSPFQTYCIRNIVAESYLQASQRLPGRFPALNVLELYLGCAADLALLAANGADVKADLRELASFRRSLSRARRFDLRWAELRNQVAASGLGHGLRRAKHLLYPPAIDVDHQAKAVEIDGREGGFLDIAECARSLPGLRPRLCRPGDGSGAGDPELRRTA